jgi:hypothetical protein
MSYFFYGWISRFLTSIVYEYRRVFTISFQIIGSLRNFLFFTTLFQESFESISDLEIGPLFDRPNSMFYPGFFLERANTIPGGGGPTHSIRYRNWKSRRIKLIFRGRAFTLGETLPELLLLISIKNFFTITSVVENNMWDKLNYLLNRKSKMCLLVLQFHEDDYLWRSISLGLSICWSIS